jgi:hypothetical protein
LFYFQPPGLPCGGLTGGVLPVPPELENLDPPLPPPPEPPFAPGVGTFKCYQVPPPYHHLHDVIVENIEFEP